MASLTVRKPPRWLCSVALYILVIMLRKWSSLFLALCLLIPVGNTQSRSPWRAATPAELEAFLPARAPVEKEHIETEMRTGTGIVNDRGRMVAAVVLITAGYAAEGKYSHYLLTQVPFRIGGTLRLDPGAYVLGWNRTPDGLLIHLFDAATGTERGSATARLKKEGTRVEPFRIWPPAEGSEIQIGRFFVPYNLE